jgi:heme exporter protein C
VSGNENTKSSRGDNINELMRTSDKILLSLGGLMALSTLILAWTYAPSVDTDAMNAPNAQKIFYWHVPSAWSSFLAYTTLFIGSLAWFWKRSEWGWKWHCAGAEVGLLFGLMVITSGPIWGQAEWERAWDWTDVRLNSYLILTALSAFLVLGRRSQPDGEDTRDTFAAVGLFGFVLVPLTAVASTLWQRSHPGAVVVGNDGGMAPEMAQVFLFGLLAFSFLSVGMLRWHIHIIGIEIELEQKMNELDNEVVE